MNLHFRTNAQPVQDDRFPTFDLREALDLDTRETVMTLELPMAYVGYHDSILSRSNHAVIENDAGLVERLNLVDHFDGGFGSSWVAVVDGYADEQTEELLELVTGLRDSGEPLDSDVYHDMRTEAELEYVGETLDQLAWSGEMDNTCELEAVDVLYAMYEIGIWVEEEPGGSFYVSNADFDAAVKHALETKAAA